MQRKPMGGGLEGCTLGVIKAVKVAAGGGAEAAAEAPAAGVTEAVPVALSEPVGIAAAEGVVEGVPVALATGKSEPVGAGAAAEGVEEGESVPVADTATAAEVGEALLPPPGAGRLTCHTPPHAMYCVGQAVEPDCWQQVNRGVEALRGLKCMR